VTPREYAVKPRELTGTDWGARFLTCMNTRDPEPEHIIRELTVKPDEYAVKPQELTGTDLRCGPPPLVKTCDPEPSGNTL
jgi:hypothetical protein